MSPWLRCFIIYEEHKAEIDAQDREEERLFDEVSMKSHDED
jgi:hypothetical protein